MQPFMPVIIVLLALIAAGSIVYIAWELSSDKFHASFGDRPEDEPSSDDEA